MRAGAVRAMTGGIDVTENPAFDVSTLKPGDEVGIEICRSSGWETWSASRVVAIHANGLIEIEGEEFYLPYGLHQTLGVGLRLAAPTDEGRWAALQEAVATDLDILSSETREMDLPTLRRLKAWVDARGWDRLTD